MNEFLRCVRYLCSRQRFDRELNDDMEFHREMAEREGRRNFGNALRLREEARDAWGWTWIDHLGQDLRYGIRVMLRSPGFTLVAVFFETMQIPMLLGRTFHPDEKNAVIVSDSFARREWPGQNPLGKLIGNGRIKDLIVGVVGDAHMTELSDDDAVEEYWPAAQNQLPSMVVVARVAGRVEDLPSAAKSISESLDPKLFPRSVKSNRFMQITSCRSKPSPALALWLPWWLWCWPA